MDINFKKIQFKDFEEPAVDSNTLNELQENIADGFKQIPEQDTSAGVSDTWEVENETTVAPSIRIVKEKFAGIDTILDNINGEVV